MGMTTMGVKLDDATRERIKTAATRIDRTPHWLIKQAIFNYLERLESDEGLPELPALLAGAANESEEAPAAGDESHQPFPNSPSRSCRSPSAAPPLPARTVAPKPTPYRCCWSRLACRKPLPPRRTAWRTSWLTNCVTRRPPPAAPGWFRVCCRNFPLLTGGRGADVPGGSAAAYSG